MYDKDWRKGNNLTQYRVIHVTEEEYLQLVRTVILPILPSYESEMYKVELCRSYARKCKEVMNNIVINHLKMAEQIKSQEAKPQKAVTNTNMLSLQDVITALQAKGE